jgi:hypothetical protein
MALLSLSGASASVLYVDLNSTNPIPPYSDWTTAATNIQVAIDAANAGDLVSVTNGTYSDGGRVYNSSLTNRVVINKPITVSSVNGPGATVIEGNPEIGSNAVRCVYLGSNAVLSGFTLSDGATKDTSSPETDGGGLWAEDLSAVASNCVFIGNQANYRGGGAVGCTLINCALSGNAGYAGGGADSCILQNCTVSGNTAVLQGGGVADSSSSNCIVTGNNTYEGGGAFHGTENNCTLNNNTAYQGGGAAFSTLNNCLVVSNSATYGGGTQSGMLNDCTVAYNSGGGAAGSALDNCITYYNGGGNYYDRLGPASLNYCCTTPMPSSGVGNIANEPDFVYPQGGNFRLRIFSPCIDVGDNALAVGAVDLDGNPRIVGSAVDIGAYEFHGSVHFVNVNNASPLAPYISWNNAATTIQAAIDAAGDGDLILVTNGLYATGGRTVNGYALTNRVVVNKPVSVQSVNGSTVTIIQGYQVPGTKNGDAAVRCVYLADGATMTGFTLTNGATRSTGDWYNEETGGAVWCDSTNPVIANCTIVGNATGDSGGGAFNGTFTNCVFANNVSLNVGGGVYNSSLSYCTMSGNSAAWGGGGAYFPQNGSAVNDCVFTNNSAGYDGGGIWGGVARNCVFAGNAATDQFYHDGSANGGGAYGYPAGVLDHCILTNNTAYSGGGAEEEDLYDCVIRNNYALTNGGGLDGCYAYSCTIVSNQAVTICGGVDYSLLINSISYFNSAPSNSNYNTAYTTVNYCCTTPQPPGGTGNFTNSPQFVDLVNEDFHLQSTSPCINSGNNSYLTNNYDSVNIAEDFDGNPRVQGGTVDVGAYEYQTPDSIISYAWLQQYGLPTDGSADYADTDHTGMNNWQKWIAGLNPLDPTSVLAMKTTRTSTNSPGVTVIWLSVSNRTYYLQQATNLAAQPAFSTIQSNITGQASTTSFTDTTATNGGPYFYRVGVQH